MLKLYVAVDSIDAFVELFAAVRPARLPVPP